MPEQPRGYLPEKQARKVREKLRRKLREKLHPELLPSKKETSPKTSLCRNPLLRVSYNDRAIRCKMGYRTDVPV